MNVRRLTLTAAAALVAVAPGGGTAAATPPDGLIACVENSKAGIEFWLENGYVQPVPPCKPLT
jgi:hypothetical protein